MDHKVDTDLNHLIARLNDVRATIGGPNKEHVTEVLGEDGLVDPFQEVRINVTTRLEDLKQIHSEIAEMKSSSNTQNSRGRIQLESDNRKITTQIEAAIKDMDDMHRTEAKKKRSKFSKADLEIRASEVAALRHQLDDMKDFARRGFVGTRETIATKRHADMKDSELFNPDPSSAGGPGQEKAPQEAVSDEQRQRMTQIRRKDKEIDAGLEQVGRGLDILKDLAMQANLEVKTQSIMLEALEEKMEDVQGQVSDINEKLKKTLEDVRSSDKLCCDVFCILVLVGMIYVLIKVSSKAA